MTFIKRQSVAFNILNNVGQDSTAEYLEKGKRGQIGEIREWQGKKYKKTLNGWEPVKEALQSESGASEEKEYGSLFLKLESKLGRGVSDVVECESEKDLKELLHDTHNLKYSDEQVSQIFSMSKKLKSDSNFKVNGQTYKQIVGEDSTKEGLKGDKKEDSYIVDNVNNGEIINSLFKEWNSIKTSEQHEKWAKRVANTKFGTYKDKTILNVMGNFNPKFPNEIIRRDFINEVQEAYKNSGGE